MEEEAAKAKEKAWPGTHAEAQREKRALKFQTMWKEET